MSKQIAPALLVPSASGLFIGELIVGTKIDMAIHDQEGRNHSMFSMIDPKGHPPKVHGKSHSFTVADQQSMFSAEFETKVWPALAVVPPDPAEKT